MPKLYVYPKNEDSFEYSLPNQKISLGRAENNDISLKDPFCSSHHAFIHPSGNNFMIQNNKSKNGTFLNGKKIDTESILKKGDEILIGSTRIKFDKELATNVEVTDAPSPSSNINTIMNVEEILSKPDLTTTIKATVQPLDFDQIRSEHKFYSVISEVSKALVLHMPLSELLEHIMNLICQHVPMDRGILMLKEGNPPQMIPKVVRINNPSLMNQRILVSQTVINMAVNKNSSIMISDAQGDSRFKAQDSIIKLNIFSAMCVPLWNNRDIIGIIYSDRISLLEQFTEEDLRLLTLLSNLAAVKIENSKLIEQAIEKEKMEKELSLAAQIQKDFLPKKDPEWKNFEITGANIPCYQVGGDYFDYIPISSDRLGIAIGDVAGKGVSASLLMASLRAALHSEIGPDYSMPDMIEKLNSFIYRSSASNRFISFFFGELNKETGEFKYINAGHNPPFILNKKGKITHLESTGLCLGMFESEKYELQKVKLNVGEIFLLYTDGIIECRSRDNTEFEEERIIDLIKKHSKESAYTIKDKVYATLHEFSAGTDPMDDMTLLVIKRIS
jgi:phosphoserine phosphatase RsbU/P